MTATTDVTIAVTSVTASISTGGLQVTVDPGGVASAIVGLPGPPGRAGEKGEPGAPGTGLPSGGPAGSVAFKQSGDDLDIGWSASLVIDPLTGMVGAGTGVPKAPLHARGLGRALVVESDLAPGKRWAISPGHPGNYDESLIVAFDDSVLDPATHVLRLQTRQPVTLPLGAVIVDGTNFGSQSSNGLAFYQPFNGTNGRLAFCGAAESGVSELAIQGTYHDGSFHTATVMTLSNSASGNQRVAIGDVVPTATLHVDGAIRTAPHSLASVPDASGSGAGTMVYVNDAAGGPRPFWSDGSDWRDAGGVILS
ncbi:hypothetical protein AB7M35_002808 [Amorphus suaedae]